MTFGGGIIAESISWSWSKSSQGDPESRRTSDSEQQAVLGAPTSFRICPHNTASKISFLNQVENQKRRQFLIRCVGVLEESEMNFLPPQVSSKGPEKSRPGKVTPH